MLRWFLPFICLPDDINDGLAKRDHVRGISPKFLTASASRVDPGRCIGTKPAVPRAVGCQLRMRRITVEPGGQFAVHDHRDRPGLFCVQGGTITEYPEGAEAREHRAGQAVAVGLRTRHWEENRGTGSVIVIAVDIIKK